MFHEYLEIAKVAMKVLLMVLAGLINWMFSEHPQLVAKEKTVAERLFFELTETVTAMLPYAEPDDATIWVPSLPQFLQGMVEGGIGTCDVRTFVDELGSNIYQQLLISHGETNHLPPPPIISGLGMMFSYAMIIGTSIMVLLILWVIYRVMFGGRITDSRVYMIIFALVVGITSLVFQFINLGNFHRVYPEYTCQQSATMAVFILKMMVYHLTVPIAVASTYLSVNSGKKVMSRWNIAKLLIVCGLIFTHYKDQPVNYLLCHDEYHYQPYYCCFCMMCNIYDVFKLMKVKNDTLNQEYGQGASNIFAFLFIVSTCWVVIRFHMAYIIRVYNAVSCLTIEGRGLYCFGDVTSFIKEKMTVFVKGG